MAFVAAGVVALSAPAFARAYGWPVKPFNQQHVIRGAFDDPRMGGSFHFGVDISVPDGTAVYAVAPGTVFRYSDAVAVRQPDGHEFGYWHVQATVPEHSYVQAGDQIGFVRPGFGHVHFAEFDGTTYVNPLRPGALTPFTDTTTPVVGPIEVWETDGTVQATVEAYDAPPMVPPAPWQGAMWTPALIRWRRRPGRRRRRSSGQWRSTRRTLPSQAAPSTRSSRPGRGRTFPARAGRFVFWLTHGISLHDGRYSLEVQASDTRGNTGSSSLAFDVEAGQGLSTTKLASR